MHSRCQNFVRSCICRMTFAALVMSSAFSYASPSISKQPGTHQAELLENARRLQVGKLELYRSGVYGKRGNSVMFFTHRDELEGEDQFYWTMVNVLSEKFGCFMKARRKTANQYSFFCRDGRTVVVDHGLEGSTRYFLAKQFDRQGREIFIKSRSPQDQLLSSNP